MNAVNEFKKLLELDFDKIRISQQNEENPLEAINRESAKLNQQFLQLGSNRLNDISSDQFDYINVDNTVNCVAENINSGVDGQHVKNFEDLIDIKLQDNQTHQNRPLRSIEKRPFLKRGEGLKRFSKGSTVKDGANVATSLQWNCQVDQLRKNCEMNMEKLTGEKSILRTQSTEKCTKKRSDFTRKVMPISSRPTIPTSNKSDTSKNSTVIPNVESIGNLNFMTNYELQNEFPISRTASNKSKQCEKGITSVEPIESKNALNAMQIMKQIDVLEKRLLDLMTLKGQLTQESHDSCPDKSSGLASSIELIKNEISTLNSKVSFLSKTSPDLGEAKEAKSDLDGRVNVDTNSRHFAAVPKHNSEPSVSTLSNGDKITVGSDQSITYVHLNGTSQTLYRDGMKVIRFPNGQLEKVYKNGTKQIIYSDGQQRLIKSDNSEEIVLSDGTVYSISAECERIEYQNGDEEWKTDSYTRRHFNNGNIKTVYANGCQETIFSNGRVRMKDKLGKVLFDRAP